MISRMALCVGICVFAAGTSGCVNFSSVLEAREAGDGLAKEYLLGKSEAMQFSYLVLKVKNHARISKNAEPGRLLGTIYGDDSDTLNEKGDYRKTYVGVWVEAVSQATSRVTCISRSEGYPSQGEVLSEELFHEQMGALISKTKAEGLK